MKQFRFILMAIAAIFLISSCDHGLSKNKFSLKAAIDGLDEGSVLLLQERSDDGMVVLDTAKLVGSTYEFEGDIESPKLAYITSNGFRGGLPIFLEAGQIKVTAHKDSLFKAVFTGSKSHDFFSTVNKQLADYDKLWQDFYYGEYRAMSKEDQALNEDKINMLYDSAQVSKAKYLEKELLANGAQAATPVLALSNIDEMDIDAVQAIYDQLSPENLGSKSAENLADRITIIKRTSLGQPLIDFTMNDVDGNPVSLSEYAAGNYVLVDFWAAWCSPCRRENPNVVANYQKYHEKGFTVFGVSFDQKEEDWKNAIQSDGLVWGQVSDLQGWDNAAGKLYGIRSIPQNILLDPNGIIIGKNLRGAALGEKLEELLGN